MPRRRVLELVAIILILAALLMGYQAWVSSLHPVIVVEWTTASELDTAGFNLYRSEHPGGPFVRINSAIIAASSDPLSGGSYSYTDGDVKAGTIYYYQLEDLETGGNTQRSETIAVQAKPGGRLELFLAIGMALAGLGFLVWLLRRQPQAPETGEKMHGPV